jgi:flagellar motility protein MotE (MotC chaperone)
MGKNVAKSLITLTTLQTMKLHSKHLFLLVTLALLPLSVHAADAVSSKDYGSVEERRIVHSILQERTNIRKELEDISMRKKELKTLEEGVDKKIAVIDMKLEELKKLQNKIESLLVAKSVKEKKQVKELATIYQKMSPVKAALVITDLDQQLTTDLLANMKVKSAAKILDQISKEKATELSTTFTTLQLE